MGSNSFRLMIGRVDETLGANGASSTQIFQVDALREPVRLAAGLTQDKYLDQPARRRGVDALRRFGDRLRDFSPSISGPWPLTPCAWPRTRRNS